MVNLSEYKEAVAVNNFDSDGTIIGIEKDIWDDLVDGNPYKVLYKTPLTNGTLLNIATDHGPLCIPEQCCYEVKS